MTASPVLSIAIPAYNHEKYITRCLDSVLEDPYPNKEIVIVDDGSRDCTLAQVNAWIEKHGHEISVSVRSRPNKGTTATFNEAWRMAKGEFVALIASDDYFLPGGFGARITYLQEHPELLAVFGDCITVDENGKTLHESTIRDFHHTPLNAYKTAKNVSFRIAWRWGLPGPVLLARRSMIDIVGPYNEARLVEDWDMYLRLAARDAIGFLNICVAAYRWHQTNSCAPERQIVILRELALSGFQRFICFRNPLMAAIVFAKASYYGIKAIVYGLRNKFSLSK